MATLDITEKILEDYNDVFADIVNVLPIITLVLYFGAKSLSELFSLPEELKPYFNDHKINLFEIAFLEEEQVQLFKSDFRIVADYFVQIRKNKNYIPSKDKIHHVEEVLKMMSALTKDSWFEESYNQSKGGVTTMCEVIDKAMNEGKIVGAVLTLNEEGYTVEEIAKRKNISIKEVERILNEDEVY